MENKEDLKEIILCFDLGKKAGMVYDSGPFPGPINYIGGTFEDIKEHLAIFKSGLSEQYSQNPYAPKKIIKVIFFMDKWGFRRVETALAEKRGMILGILYGLRHEYFLEVLKFNESAVYTQMRKLHPSPINEKKHFTTDLLSRVYSLNLNQDAADAALLYYYYLFLVKSNTVYEDMLTLK